MGQLFFQVYDAGRIRSILDIGGKDVNGTLRPFAPTGAEYVGIDLEAGPGVDIVADDPYRYPFPAERFDAVISTSCLEHDQLFWLTFLECVRVLKADGLLYFNAPSQGVYHGYPYDHWRFYPDAGIALQEWSRRMNQPVYLVESFIHPDLPFNDCVMIFSRNKQFQPDEYVHERVPGACNIRKGPSVGPLINPKPENRAVELMKLFGQEIQRLRAKLAEAEAAAGKLSVAMPPTTRPSASPGPR
jgi:SAM-dependent methyltransferase